jgi:uncharacterized protein YbjT (DUF2867 family)
MKVCVVGGTGTLGLPAVRALVEAGHEVRAPARGEAKSQLVRKAGAEAVSVDIYDVAALRSLSRGCDAAVRLTTEFGRWTATLDRTRVRFGKETHAHSR